MVRMAICKLGWAGVMGCMVRMAVCKLGWAGVMGHMVRMAAVSGIKCCVTNYSST